MSDDKPESTIDMPFQAGSDACVMVMLAAAVEVGQYFNIVKLLRLDGIRFFRILLGSTFSFLDIACYFAGAVLCLFADIAGRRLRSA